MITIVAVDIVRICFLSFLVTFAERAPGLTGTGLRGVSAEEVEGLVVPEALACDAVAGALTPNRAALSIALSCSVNGIPKRAALLLRFSISALSASSLLAVSADGADPVADVSVVFAVVEDDDGVLVAEAAAAGTEDDDVEDGCLSTAAFSTGAAVLADLEAAGATGSEGGGGARSLKR